MTERRTIPLLAAAVALAGCSYLEPETADTTPERERYAITVGWPDCEVDLLFDVRGNGTIVAYRVGDGDVIEEPYPGYDEVCE